MNPSKRRSYQLDSMIYSSIHLYTFGLNTVVANWLRNRNTIEYLGIWETLNNPDFKPLEFEGFMNQAGANAFTLSPKK